MHGVNKNMIFIRYDSLYQTAASLIDGFHCVLFKSLPLYPSTLNSDDFLKFKAIKQTAM